MKNYSKPNKGKRFSFNFNLLNFWKLKISQQIFAAFSIVIFLTIILFIINLWSINRIGNANKQLIKGYAYRSILTKMTNTSTIGQIQANLLRRFVEKGNQLEIKDDILIATIATEVGSVANEVEPVINELSSDKLTDFQALVEEVLNNCNAWQGDKGAGTLFAIAGTLMKFKLMTTDLATTLNALIDAQIATAETQVRFAKIFNFLLNSAIPVFLLIIILPLLSNLRKLFHPVREAADNALQGAANAFENAAQINESIAELKHVLVEITRSISDVSLGAQDSTNQVEKIIGSIQITSDLVAELGEIANTVYKNLDANQNNIQDKISQVKQLSENVSQSLEMINKNADVAAKLAIQVNNLEQQMEGINSFLVAMGEITEQTNLLALNASIEAARAEEHGKGFAVVAERIRNLSDETKKFTTQIKHTVTGIQVVANEVAGALNNIITAVRSSASEVSDVNQEFSNLKHVLESLYSSNAAILQAADLQLDGTKQIHTRSLEMTKAVENITAQTEQVSASMEELAASSQEITAQIELIHTKVTETKEVVERQLEMAKLTKETADYI